jgi:hypothetical protein
MIKPLLLNILFFCVVGCGFNNKFELPSQINSQLTVKDSTHTVRHEISISLEMQTMFENACSAEADEQNLQEPLRSEAIKLCVAKATTDFINSLMAVINSQGGK